MILDGYITRFRRKLKKMNYLEKIDELITMLTGLDSNGRSRIMNEVPLQDDWHRNVHQKELGL